MKVECWFCGKKNSVARNKAEQNNMNFCNNDHRSRYHDRHGRNRQERMLQVVLYIQNHGPTTKNKLGRKLDIPRGTMKDLLDELRHRSKVYLQKEDGEWIYKLRKTGVDYNETMSLGGD